MQYLVLLIATIWLLSSGFWLITLVGIIALFLSPKIFIILLMPTAYFLAYSIKYTTWPSNWKSYILTMSILAYMILIISLWGYCVFQFIVIPGEISIPAILLGYIVATKIFVSFMKIDLQTGNYNVCCFVIFSQVAFISSLVAIISLQSFNKPIILSYLITGLIAAIALTVVWSMGKGYEQKYIANKFLKKF